MSGCILKVEVSESCRGDFSEFLTLHKGVTSFQRVDNYFLVNVLSEGREGISTLIHSIGDVYDVISMKETPLCQAKCRDGTECLNRARYENYCWKHQYLIMEST